MLVAVLAASGCGGTPGAKGLPFTTPEGPDECGVIGSVAVRFVIPAGQDYHDVLPEAGDAPELEGISGATVIVYQGEVELRNVGGIPGVPPETALRDAICVITPDGVPNVYSDVSRRGIRLPGATPTGSTPSGSPSTSPDSTGEQHSIEPMMTAGPTSTPPPSEPGPAASSSP